MVWCFLSSESDAPLKKFIQQTVKMTPEERAVFLEKDEVRRWKRVRKWENESWSFSLSHFFLFPPQSIRVTHESSAQEGQTEVRTVTWSPWRWWRWKSWFTLKNLCLCLVCFSGSKFRWESESSFYSLCERWREFIWAGWVFSTYYKLCVYMIIITLYFSKTVLQSAVQNKNEHWRDIKEHMKKK